MGLEFGKHPVGTGAFKFVEWKPNQEIVLEANPDYWGQKPKIKRLVFRNIKDNSQRLAALKAGEIHGMEGLNPDDVEVVKADPNLQVLRRPTNNVGYIAFNYNVKEFQDKRCARRSPTRSTRRGSSTPCTAAPAWRPRSSSRRRSGDTTRTSRATSTARPRRRIS